MSVEELLERGEEHFAEQSSRLLSAGKDPVELPKPDSFRRAELFAQLLVARDLIAARRSDASFGDREQPGAGRLSNAESGFFTRREFAEYMAVALHAINKTMWNRVASSKYLEEYENLEVESLEARGFESCTTR